jgi:predicted CDP-diglyceride synthetase/phosphatidate cytidylyltransferase
MVPVPPIVVALAFALRSRSSAPRRGGAAVGSAGPELAGFCFFAPLLVALPRERIVALPLLGILMFVALREYFFLAPLRPRDRFVILAAYLTIPLALFACFEGSWPFFFAVVPVALFLVLPVLLASLPQPGLFDAAGRVLVGTVAFVFCAAHLGLMAGAFENGEIELFGVLLICAELPRRLVGRARAGGGLLGSLAGAAAGALVAAVAGTALARYAGMGPRPGALAGIVVAFAAGAGALLAEGMAQDLNRSASSTRMGRGAFLDQTFPAVYAAPAYFHCVLYLMAFR